VSPVVVLSPHLDDAVMSLGGTMHVLGRLGVATRVVTLFAGDPERCTPPSYWDEHRGTKTAGEAFGERRDEDRAACDVLGVEPVWLPFIDDSYLARRDPDEIWAAVEPHLADAAAVLTPGTPLAHGDHRYTTALAVERLGTSLPTLFYAEQPYSSRPRYLAGYVRGRTPSTLEHIVDEKVEWSNVKLDEASRDAKRDAAGCYTGEIAMFGARARVDDFVARVLRRESVGHRAGAALPAIFGGVL
jgi:LmbE family N-acetylglucosaminyl deacetylase